MVDLVRDKIDSEKAKQGVWVDITDFGRVKIRRWNNPDYRNRAMDLRDAKLEELGKTPQDMLSDDESFEIMVKAACEEIIVDWEGIEADGKPVAYDSKLAIAAFTDPDDSWRDEFNLIVSAANSREKYARERKEENTKKP